MPPVLDDEEGRYLSRQSAQLTQGYSWRLWFLGQAVVCWIFFGILTVVLCQRGGAWLLENSDVLRRVAQKLSSLPSYLRLGVPFLLLDLWSYLRHRLEHANRERGLLWRLVHRWHHRPREMNL